MGLKRSTEQLQFLLTGGLWLLSLLKLYAGLLPRLEYQFSDWSLRSLAARHAPDADIVIIDIDEPSLAAMTPEYGRYPWSRAVYGSLLEGLARQQPTAIVFDILFTDPQLDHEQDDLYFIEVARASAHMLPDGASVLGAYAASQRAGELGKVINVGTEVYARGLDKKDEFAADYCALLAVLQTLSSINPQDDAVVLMFKTHPEPSVRIGRLLPALEDQFEKYAGQPNNADRFAEMMRTHVQRYGQAGK